MPRERDETGEDRERGEVAGDELGRVARSRLGLDVGERLGAHRRSAYARAWAVRGYDRAGPPCRRGGRILERCPRPGPESSGPIAAVTPAPSSGFGCALIA